MAPSLRGNSKPWGQRSVRAAIEAICLVVGSTGEPWLGRGDQASQNISFGKKEKNKQHQSLNRRHVHRLRSLSHHTHVTTTCVHPYFADTLFALVRHCYREKEGEKERMLTVGA